MDKNSNNLYDCVVCSWRSNCQCDRVCVQCGELKKAVEWCIKKSDILCLSCFEKRRYKSLDYKSPYLIKKNKWLEYYRQKTIEQHEKQISEKKIFEKRNHLKDPMINLVCPYCSRDLYPFKSIDRFELVLETLSELKKGSYIKIKCLSCKSIFRERRSRHKAWIYHYYQIIREIFEKKTEESLIIRVNSSFKKTIEKTKGEK